MDILLIISVVDFLNLILEETYANAVFDSVEERLSSV